MTRLAITVTALLAAVSLKAAEHPKEHPAGAPASDQREHPGQSPKAASGSDSGVESVWMKKRPAEKGQLSAPEGSKAWLQQIRNDYDDAVRQYVKSKDPFVIHDEKFHKGWKLTLIRVHKDRIVSLGNNRFFACSDFKSVRNGEKDKLDLDFFATKTPDGTWNVEKVLIHKVNGKPRYTWNDKNEMVPAND